MSHADGLETRCAAQKNNDFHKGEMTERVRAYDWAATPLGPADQWPVSRKSIVDVILSTGFPMVALWGPELIQVYNDGYRDIIGAKHPAALGQRACDCWPESWHINEPIYAQVLAGETLIFEDKLYPINRHGRLEDAWFKLSYSPIRDEAGTVAGILVTLIETTPYRKAASSLRDRASWLRGQREALMAAVNGAPLETSLGTLMRTANEALGEDVRAAFYLANRDGASLHQVGGMPAEYAEIVDGFPIGPDSLACGLATHTGEPIITVDVQTEPRWEPWRWLANRFNYRSCWSFPIVSTAGTFVGSLAIYSQQPHEAGERDLELCSLLTNTASIIISRHVASEERAQAEQALRESHAELERLAQRFDVTLSTIKDHVFSFDRDGRVLYANRNLIELWGLQPGEEVGKDLAELNYPPELQRILLGYVRRVFESGEVIHDEAPYTSPTGIVGYYDYIMSPAVATDGKVEYVIGSARDTSERKRVEEALSESEEKYRTLFTSMDEGFCTIEVLFDETGEEATDYCFLETNPAFVRQAGLENAVGKTMRELVPRHEKFWYEIYGRVARTGASVRFEHEAVALDRYFDVYAFRIGAPGENRVAVLFNDIRERKQAEKALREANTALEYSNEMLEAGVAERTEALAQRTAQVQELLRQIVSVQEEERARISRELHDQFGQHLTGFMLAADALRVQQQPGSEAEGMAERLRQIAADLSKEVHQLAWDLRPAALDEIGLTAVLSTYVREWGERSRIAADFFTTAKDGKRLPSEVETALYRIAQEALTNVTRHAVGANKVSVLLEGRQQQIQLMVEDNGLGFDPESAENSSRLGLRGMRERAALLGGTLEVESSPGSGTTLFIRIPLDRHDGIH